MTPAELAARAGELAGATGGILPWLLVGLVAAGWILRWRRRRRALPHPRTPVLLDASGPVRGRLLALWSPAWRSAALLLVAAALAFPRVHRETVERRPESLAVVAAVDVSRSMRAEDFAPGNRMQAARRELREFVDGRQGDMVGIVAFGGRTMTVVPPTRDLELVRRSVAGLEAGMLGDGTALGDALAVSLARLREVETESRVVVLLTDGASNTGRAEPGEALQAARSLGVRVHAVGVGRGGYVPVPVQDEDGEWRRVRARLDVNEELLRRLAERTGGVYRRADDRAGLSRIYGEIDRMERTPVREVEVVRGSSVRTWLLELAAVALALELLGAATRAREFGGP